MKNDSADCSSHSARLLGLFVDMFTTPMIDVANELGLPCYLFFASPASFLGFMLHLPKLEDTQLLIDHGNSDADLVIPSFAHPLPRNLLPTTVLKRLDGYRWYLYNSRRYRETKGFIINTFQELESHALSLLEKDENPNPPIFAIGPVLDAEGPARWHPNWTNLDLITKWLDDQPPSSVVFLCFGSMGSLSGPQVKEIASGLERSGLRFLWALREPPKAELILPEDYANLEDVLPAGFLRRTSGTGIVCGWVPQAKILGHGAIGGFVSHCGWNSILESLWHGAPIAAWPLYAEQQMNAFQLVAELGLAVEMKMEYREDGDNLVTAEDVETLLRRLMDGDGDVMRKAKAMREKCRTTVTAGGSSYVALGSLIRQLQSTV